MLPTGKKQETGVSTREQIKRAWVWVSGRAGYARTLILTMLAGLAFAVLLHWHHNRFAEDIISGFQSHQGDMADRLAKAAENAVEAEINGLRVLRAYPAVQERQAQAHQVLDEYVRSHRETLDAVGIVGKDKKSVFLAANRGNVERDFLAEMTLPQVGDRGNWNGVWFSTTRNWLSACILIGGRNADDVLWLRINLTNLLARCLATSQDKRMCWIIGPGGRLIHGPDRAGSGPKEDSRLGVEENRLLASVAFDCVQNGRRGALEIQRGEGTVLVAYSPFIIGDRRYAIALGSAKSNISVPLVAHERTIYALIAALALLYFATGYVSSRSEHARAELERRRRQEAELVSKAKTDFLARMSHEIRTPLSGVIGMLDLATQDGGAEHRQRYLEMAKRSADSLLRVVNDILDMSKIEAGKLELAQVPFDIRDCLRDTLEPLRFQAEQKGLVLSARTEEDVPAQLVGDPGRLRQVLTNLVGNAVKFTRQGTIQVRLSLDQGGADRARLLYEVIDSGEGIPADRQRDLFKPFEQVHQTQVRGTGLGLAISAQLVEMMGGRIWLESREGQGSTFRFTAVLAAPSAPAGGARAKSVSLHKARALLASPCRFTRDHMERTLTQQGMEVSCAGDGASALDAARQAAARGRPFHVALLAADLPDMTGLKTAGAIRRQANPPRIILLAASGMRGDAIECERSGVAGYLGDMDAADIVNMVRAVLSAGGEEAGLITRHNLRESARKLRILVAEDNPVNQEYVQRLLESWGHHVFVVATGVDAAAAASQGNYDLVLMDIQMPRMDGYQATAAIREREKTLARRVPIYAMTADVLGATVEHCLKEGMDGCVSKPILPERLREVLEQAARQAPTDAQAPASDGEGQAQPPPRRRAERDLLERFNGNTELLGRVADTFLRTSSQMLAEMSAAVNHQDAATIARLAHNLKSSVGLLGGPGALAATVVVQDAGRSGDIEAARMGFAVLVREINLLRGSLAATCKENAHANSGRG